MILCKTCGKFHPIQYTKVRTRKSIFGIYTPAFIRVCDENSRWQVDEEVAFMNWHINGAIEEYEAKFDET